MVKSVVKHIFDCFFHFPNRPKYARLKGFRRFSLSCGVKTAYAPKPPALPAAPHPDLFNFCDFGICGILYDCQFIITHFSGKIKSKNPRVRVFREVPGIKKSFRGVWNLWETVWVFLMYAVKFIFFEASCDRLRGGVCSLFREGRPYENPSRFT